MKGVSNCLNALTNLQYLRRVDTKVTDVVSCLSALTILQAFYLYRTEVTGDIGGVLVSPSWRRTPEPRWAEPAGVCLAETHRQLCLDRLLVFPS